GTFRPQRGAGGANRQVARRPSAARGAAPDLAAAAANHRILSVTRQPPAARPCPRSRSAPGDSQRNWLHPRVSPDLRRSAIWRGHSKGGLALGGTARTATAGGREEPRGPQEIFDRQENKPLETPKMQIPERVHEESGQAKEVGGVE